MWKGFDNIKKPTKPIPDPGGGGVSDEVIKIINDHIKDKEVHLSESQIIKINNSVSIKEVKKILSKDIVFKLVSPIDPGIQNDTEFLYPNKGIISNISISTSLDSEPSSNIIFAIHKYDKGWKTIATTQLQVGEHEINVTCNEPINNNRLRLVVLDGDISAVKNMSVVMRVSESNE